MAKDSTKCAPTDVKKQRKTKRTSAGHKKSSDRLFFTKTVINEMKREAKVVDPEEDTRVSHGAGILTRMIVEKATLDFAEKVREVSNFLRGSPTNNARAMETDALLVLKLVDPELAKDPKIIDLVNRVQ